MKIQFILMLKTLLVAIICMGAFEGNTQAVKGVLKSTWKDPSLPSSSAHDNTYNEVWGLAHNGREYAVIGSTYGTHIIDVTNPVQISEIQRIKGGAIGRQIIHRDYKSYRNYLYAVCDEGSTSTLQIIDIRGLPDTAIVVYDNSKLMNNTHNIYIDTAQARLYALYTSSDEMSFAPMRSYNLEDPTKPTFIASYSSIGGVTLEIGGIHDAFVKDHIAYLNNGNNGLVIADMKDPNNAKLITHLAPADYPQPGYNHSGYLNAEGTHYYMADENHGVPMKALDVSALPDVNVTAVFNAESSSSASIPHNQIAHKGHLYVSYYFDGLQVFDIATNPAIPKRVMYYPTSSRAHANGRYQGSWGVYPFLPSGNILVSDMQEGLFVVAPVGTLSSISDENESVIEVIPNPVTSTFKLGDLEGYDKITLLNPDGRLVQTWEAQEVYTLDERIPSGIYMISISGKKDTKTFQMVILRK